MDNKVIFEPIEEPITYIPPGELTREWLYTELIRANKRIEHLKTYKSSYDQRYRELAAKYAAQEKTISHLQKLLAQLFRTEPLVQKTYYKESYDYNTLPVRLKTVLSNHSEIMFGEDNSPKIKNPAELAKFKESYYLRMPNLGRRSVRILKEWISQYGFTFAPEND